MLGCGGGEIPVFFPPFSLLFLSLYCVSAGIPFVQLVLIETFVHYVTPSHPLFFSLLPSLSSQPANIGNLGQPI